MIIQYPDTGCLHNHHDKKNKTIKEYFNGVV